MHHCSGPGTQNINYMSFWVPLWQDHGLGLEEDVTITAREALCHLHSAKPLAAELTRSTSGIFPRAEGEKAQSGQGPRDRDTGQCPAAPTGKSGLSPNTGDREQRLQEVGAPRVSTTILLSLLCTITCSPAQKGHTCDHNRMPLLWFRGSWVPASLCLCSSLVYYMGELGTPPPLPVWLMFSVLFFGI